MWICKTEFTHRLFHKITYRRNRRNDVATETKPTNEQDSFFLLFSLLKETTSWFWYHVLTCYSKPKLPHIALPAPSISLMKIECVFTMDLKHISPTVEDPQHMEWSVTEHKQDTQDSLWRAHVKQTMIWDSTESPHAPLRLIRTHHSPLTNTTTHHRHLPSPAN